MNEVEKINLKIPLILGVVFLTNAFFPTAYGARNASATKNEDNSKLGVASNKAIQVEDSASGLKEESESLSEKKPGAETEVREAQKEVVKTIQKNEEDGVEGPKNEVEEGQVEGPKNGTSKSNPLPIQSKILQRHQKNNDVIDLSKSDEEGFEKLYEARHESKDRVYKIQMEADRQVRDIKYNAHKRLSKESLSRDVKIAKIKQEYNLYSKNIITVDLGVQYVFAEIGRYNDKAYLDHVGDIVQAKQLSPETMFFSLSGSISYTRMLNRKSFINISLTSRGANDKFLTDTKGIKSNFASTTLSIVFGSEVFRKGIFYIRPSVGVLFSFVYIDPVSDKNVANGANLQAEGLSFQTDANGNNLPRPGGKDDYLHRIGTTNTFGVNIAFGVDFGLNINKVHSVVVSVKGSIGPESLYYNHKANVGFSAYGGLEAKHEIFVNELLDFYYKVGFGFVYIKDYSGDFFLEYFSDLFVTANAGVSFKF